MGVLTDTEKKIVLLMLVLMKQELKISVWEVGVTDNEDMVEVIVSNEEGYTNGEKGASGNVRSAGYHPSKSIPPILLKA